MHLSQKDAAMALGVSCSTLRRRILEYKIRWPRSKQEKQEQKETMENGGPGTALGGAAMISSNDRGAASLQQQHTHGASSVGSSPNSGAPHSQHFVHSLSASSDASYNNSEQYQLISKEAHEQLLEENRMLKTCLHRMQTMFVLSQQHNNYDMQAFPTLLPSPNGMTTALVGTPHKNGCASSNSTNSSDCNSTVMHPGALASPPGSVAQLGPLPTVPLHLQHSFSPSHSGAQSPMVPTSSQLGGANSTSSNSSQVLNSIHSHVQHHHTYSMLPQQRVNGHHSSGEVFHDQFEESAKGSCDILSGDLE
eukprot:CAMPEP_0117452284 /NCGR_PEP_ID=MMETSP0759-20121206/9519_1 /TAXON_ID=63605 /ORGANISM="Percolomonas cosmopolitus, Strain WS" /LENGTH=306 /DNA_ID=CAMNT_0005245061 /DNA_START=692 /DNA_END=1612 /DNA_ORIENTATION=+